MTYIFHWKQASLRLWAYGIATILGLWFSRSMILGMGPMGWLKRPGRIAQVLAASQMDIVWVLGLCLIGGLILMWFNRKRWIRRLVFIPFLILLAFTLIIGVGYWRFKEMTGHPITYPWLVYSDFLKSNDAKLTIIDQLKPQLLLALGALLSIWAVLGFGLSKIFVATHRHIQIKRWVRIGLGALFIGYFGWSSWYLGQKDFSRAEVISPIPHFLTTLPGLQATPEVYDRSLAPSLTENMVRWHTPLDTLSQPDSSIRNVLIYVLESTPEHLLNLDDSLDPFTPNLARFRQQSRLFPNAYSPVPSTNKAMFSLLTGMYPLLSFSSITSGYYDIEVEDISQLSWDAGLRTGFFTSADNRFQHIDSFLHHRQFDRVMDYQSLPCETEGFVSANGDWQHLDGRPDACMTPGLVDWIDEAPQSPFMAVCWTVQTHFPYFFTGTEKPLDPDDSYRNRFLNALHDSDAAFGAMMDSLQSRGLDSSTLVIVLGDHGEAFGEHDQYGHASYLYEENVRIP
ncbi:MAG: LTA synthase family protein, partial [Bacteroidota bacterium]